MIDKNVFQCPNCGGPLDPDKAKGKYSCPYCRTLLDIKSSNHYDEPRISINSKAIKESVYSFSTVNTEPVKNTAAIFAVIGFVLVGILAGGVFLLINTVKTTLPIIGNNEIQKVFELGSKGTGPGYFDDVRYVETTNNGLILTCEYENGRIQVFDSSGNYIRQWTIRRKSYVQSIAADSRGRLYAVCQGGVYIFDVRDGSFVDSIPKSLVSAFCYEEIAISPSDGSIYLLYDHDNLAKLDKDFSVIWTIEEVISSNSDDSELQCNIALDGAGYVYILGVFNKSVFKFSPEGKFLTRIGSEGDGPGSLGLGASDVAADNQSNIYISDFDGIEVFNSNGKFLTQLSVERPTYGLFIDKDNMLYTANYNKISKYALFPENYAK
ncbi:hypothetical protein JW890_05230 [candidate division WOR-3 bacterium]|nr:hypothetical protein [candidate division WOR-3 bacterium]